MTVFEKSTYPRFLNVGPIYLHLGGSWGFHVGKYNSCIEHLCFSEVTKSWTKNPTFYIGLWINRKEPSSQRIEKTEKTCPKVDLHEKPPRHDRSFNKLLLNLPLWANFPNVCMMIPPFKYFQYDRPEKKQQLSTLSRWPSHFRGGFFQTSEVALNIIIITIRVLQEATGAVKHCDGIEEWSSPAS